MVAAAHVHAFYREVAKFNEVYTVGRDGAPVLVQGQSGSVLPVWSSRSRAEKIVGKASGYESCVVLGMPWDEFERTQLGELAQSGIGLGVNWSGRNANGFEMPALAVAEMVQSAKSADA